MLKLTYIFGVFLVMFIVDSSCQRFIQPTYRPPRRKPVIIRAVREADEPLWLYEGDNIERAPATADHPVLPSVIDHIKLDPNRRYVRSLDSPSAKRGGGSHAPTGGRDTGATHSGYNRRNAREVRLPEPFRFPSPTIPKPIDIDPIFPRPWSPRQPYPIYARARRDIEIPGIKKPSHRDIIIPNWNPNIRTQPWQRFGGKKSSQH
ncbi:lebocin-4-like [Achroia grisella]|uniref:lebocin-4-like n=1 Tax=Achroia grisella TaxID=688607 RepID=UPI0027D1EDDA|nr:lebocin-4-like [Achroia grisella]